MISFKVAFLALLSFQLGFLTHGQPSLNDNPIQNVQSGYQDLIKDQTEDQGIEYEKRSDEKSILEINNFQMGSFPNRHWLRMKWKPNWKWKPNLEG